MFARNVAVHLKPNSLGEFTRIFDSEVLPLLQSTHDNDWAQARLSLREQY
jgi:hypothetical protein